MPPSCVIGAPVDERLFHPRPRNLSLRRAQGIGDAECVLAYTGNLHAGNRDELSALYQAVERLNRQGTTTHLLRTGLDPKTSDQALPIGPDLRAHILHLGWVPRQQLPEVLAAADILVQPGSAGPFNDQRIPSKLPEYFAMGRPVILPRSNLGLRARHGEHAWVLDAADGASIADAVQTLRANPQRTAALAKGAGRFWQETLQADPNTLFGFLREQVARTAKPSSSADADQRNAFR
ncbi:MAG: glycosyltransferase [Gammaproteobacteria bacterium]|nr:glycosyltransferase [Gammaproteobacteria bacterium]